jgi:uncharacterized protein (TIGR02996 family)
VREAVTEDEGFIRAVVDGPGDDTPRLVYADWLDDHSDPRGPYLRAELEWAKPWKNGTTPGWSPRSADGDQPEWAQEAWPGLDAIRARGRGLDPVWVARVSRPPAGVCSDQLVFQNSGPRVSPNDIAVGEARLRLRFPPAFTAFLLNTNGGEPRPSTLVFRYRDCDAWNWDWVHIEYLGRLRSATEPGPAAAEGPVWPLEALQAEVPAWREGDPAAAAIARKYLVVGRYSDTDFLLMRPTGKTAGSVFGLDPDDEKLTPRPLASSLPEFLGRIIPNPPF